MNDLPFSLEKMDDNEIREAIKNGYEPKKDDLIKHPELLKYYWFLELAFAYDPSIITLFPSESLNINLCNDAIARGFIPTKDDLFDNPELFKYINIVKTALLNDPSLIVYLDSEMPIDDEILKYAITNYKLTDRDFKKHPNLGKNYKLMLLLGDEYEIYSDYLSNERKKEIISSYIYNDNIEGLCNLPFLSYNNDISITHIIFFTNSLYRNIDETNIDEEEKAIRILDKLVDGIVDVKYKIAKTNFKFNNINSLDAFIRKFFINKMNLYVLSDYLYQYVNGKTSKRKFIDKYYITRELHRLYNLFLNNELTDKDSLNFYNEILNDHENRFKSEYKICVNSIIKDQLRLSSKKRKVIIKGRKIKKVGNLIKNNKYELLGTTESEILSKLQELRVYIPKIRSIRRNNIIITEDDFSYFEKYFLKHGILDFITIDERIKNKEISKIIEDKYNQFKIQFIDKVHLSKKESKIGIYDKEKIEYNYNNYLIEDKKRFCDNLADIIINLKSEVFDKIYSNKNISFSVFSRIIPYINLTDEFTTNDFINMLSVYDKVSEKISSISGVRSIDLLTNNFSDFITLSRGYSDVNKLGNIILGDEVFKEVEHIANDYLSIYLDAYNRQYGSIPRVYGKINDKYTYESANYRDVDRLLIGYIQDGSCIKLNNLAGGDTFKECLLDENSDVILIKDEDELIGRLLIFRRGNIIMLAPMVTKYYNKSSLLTKEFASEVAEQIIEASELNNDNIDFVFLNYEESKQISYKDYEVYSDMRFKDLFPHADLCPNAFLIKYSDKIKNILEDNITDDIIQKRKFIIKNFDYKSSNNHRYLRLRESIRVGKTNDEITRIKALRIELEPDLLLKEELRRNFEPFYEKEYKYVISGEDWYIAIKNDDSIEEVIVPTDDKRALEEINIVKNRLKKEYKIK